MNIRETTAGEQIRRKYKRYITDGSVSLQGKTSGGFGVLVNLGRGGVLIRSDSLCPQVGDEYAFRFTVRGFERELEAGGIIVGGHSNLLAMQFLKEPPGLESVLDFMEQSHYPWTGAN